MQKQIKQMSRNLACQSRHALISRVAKALFTGMVHPEADAQALANCVAFYPAPLDCSVDGAVVVPQPGGFYGGWITPELVGPFKGDPGSEHW